VSLDRQAAAAGPAVRLAAGLVALVLATLIAAILAWFRAAAGWPNFGLDLIAYEQAASRLIETGSPYAAELTHGPIANVASNVPIGYFYPPPIAQLFTLLRGVDHRLLAIAWAVLPAAALLVLLPRVWRSAGGVPGLTPLVWIAAFAVASYPLQFALLIGNVSGWVAVLIAAALLIGPRAQGPILGAATLMKTIHLPFLAAAFGARDSRRSTVVVLLVVVGASVAVAPRAWLEWLAVLPNIMATPVARAPDSVSLASWFADTEYATVAAAVGLVLAGGLAIAAFVLGRREGLSRRTLTVAAAASVLLSPTIWEHYLALMVPLVVAAWPRLSSPWRVVLTFGALTHLAGWVGGLGVLRPIMANGGLLSIVIASLVGGSGLPDSDATAGHLPSSVRAAP
jgi:hypothetical protein